jgi:type II secretory pathway component PulF
VRAGQTLHQAGTRSGILLPWEARLLAIGSAHGRLDRVLDDLAGYHQHTADWWSRLRMRLLFPVGILILGFLTLPLPRLFAGQLSLSSYLLQNLVLAVILVLLWTLAGTARVQQWFSALLLRCRPVSNPAWQYQRYRFLQQLASLYNAGMTILEALPLAVHHCEPAWLQRQWSMVETAVREGSGISEALHRYQALDDTGFALLHSGEASGRLGEMFDRVTEQLGKRVALWLDSLVEWLPRLAYILVLLLLLGL